MRQFCEALQSRVLLSGTVESVTGDYQAVVVDATTLKSDFVSAAATYRANVKIIAADIKALGRSSTNSKDISLLNRAVSKAIGPDSSDGGALISAGKASINRAKSAFQADLTRPTTPNAARLTKALGALAVVLAPFEAKIAIAVAAGDAGVDAALNTLVTANPTDPSLATAVSAGESDQTGALLTISSAVTTTNADIIALVSDIE